MLPLDMKEIMASKHTRKVDSILVEVKQILLVRKSSTMN